MHLKITIDRRTALKRLSILAAGYASAACTPARILLHCYPDDLARQPLLTEQVLRAFVITVIPGAPPDDPSLIRAYYDTYYPLARYRDFLVADLCERSRDPFRIERFDRLSPNQRTAVIHSGLDQGGTTARLYNGAIFLAQIAVFGGIYDDERGCPLIGFEGRYRGLDAVSYPDPERFLPRSSSADGHPS